MAKIDWLELFPATRAIIEAIEKAGGMCNSHDEGYGCTLPWDHDGEHTAHSRTGAVLHTWPNVPVNHA